MLRDIVRKDLYGENRVFLNRNKGRNIIKNIENKKKHISIVNVQFILLKQMIVKKYMINEVMRCFKLSYYV